MKSEVGSRLVDNSDRDARPGSIDAARLLGSLEEDPSEVSSSLL